MKIDRRVVFLVLGLVVPVIVVFRALFLPGPLAWGDAPHFYPEGLKELASGPYIWTSRGNDLGGVNGFLWLWPLMYLYGALNKYLGLDNDAIIRILFYFPAVILAVVSPVVLTRYLKQSRVVQFFAALVYSLNTYFILLVDGGQVGVALAYGILPLGILGLRMTVDRLGWRSFGFGVGGLLLLAVADVRMAVIAVLALVVWVLVEALNLRTWVYVKRLWVVLVQVIVVGALNLYWVLSVVSFGNRLGIEVSGLQLVSLLNVLLMYQPHWPGNEFGKVLPPLFYFVGVPILVFGGLILARKRTKSLVWAMIFLIFGFLAKGEAEPLGSWYLALVSRLPLGTAFRDASKFFAPMMLFGGMLVGMTVERLSEIWRGRKWMTMGVAVLVYGFWVSLVAPAMMGKLNWVLSGRNVSGDFEKVYEKLKDEPGFLRTVWFPERHPLAFFTEEKPAVDAKGLADFRSLAALNVGSYDRFNFMHQGEFLDWLRLLGVKYLIFSGDPRALRLDKETEEEWRQLLSLADETGGLAKVDWGVGFPVYRLGEVSPRIFAVKQVLAVVGGDGIYDRLAAVRKGFFVGDQGVVFLEDGKLDPRRLAEVGGKGVVLVFNGKTETDLRMSFLQDNFIEVARANDSQWALRKSSDYLRYKYELLVGGIETKEFDYGRGVAFSSQAKEKIKLNLEVPEDGSYMLAVRQMGASGSGALKMVFDGEAWEVGHGKSGEFEWMTKPVDVKKGEHGLVLENEGGWQVVNVVALVRERDWEGAGKWAEKLTGRFKTVDADSQAGELAKVLSDEDWREVEVERISPARYKVEPGGEASWLVFTDKYDEDWRWRSGGKEWASLSFWSMVNGFYVGSSGGEVVFGGQDEIRRGEKLSVGAAAGVVMIGVWLYFKKR